MRSMNCIAEKDCNQYDKNKNYYQSCKEAITDRMDQPNQEDVYFNINTSNPTCVGNNKQLGDKCGVDKKGTCVLNQIVQVFNTNVEKDYVLQRKTINK